MVITLRHKDDLPLVSWRGILWLFFPPLPNRRGREYRWMTVTKQWSLCCFSTVPSFDSYELDKKTAVNKAKRTWEYTLKESNYHSSLWSVEIQSAVVLWTLFFRQLTHTHRHHWMDCSGMDAGFSSLRSEAAGAMRTVLVSAENLQFTLKPELSQEEQSLTHTNSSPKDSHKAGYCSKTTQVIVFL